MAKLTPEQLYNAAHEAGFGFGDSIVMAGTAMAESSGDPNASNPSGAKGLLQFEANTWPAGIGCSIWDPSCQFKAAKQVMGGGFSSSVWHDKWVKNWDASAKKRFNDAFASLNTSGVNKNPLTGDTSISQTPDPLGGTTQALGDLGGAIGGVAGGIFQAFKSLLTHVGLFAAILLVLYLILKRLGEPSPVKVNEAPAPE